MAVTTTQYMKTFPNNLLNISDWIGLSSVLHPRQQSIGYMGDILICCGTPVKYFRRNEIWSFYRSKDPTNSIKVLKEQIVHRQIN